VTFEDLLISDMFEIGTLSELLDRNSPTRTS